MPGRPTPSRAVTIDALSDFHRSLSRATTADEAFCAMDEAMASLLPIRGLIQAERTEPGGPPRLTVGIPFGGSAVPTPLINHCQNPAGADPLSHPGLLAAATDEPVIVGGLDPAEMPIPLSASATSVAVVPVFRAGQAGAWIYVFLEPQHTELEGLLDTLLSIANLFDRAVEALGASERATRAASRYEFQLNELGRVQRLLLPDPLPAIPGLELTTDYRPSHHAGGDLYSFTTFRPETITDPGGAQDLGYGVMIGDVSGHGPAAAAVMAIITTILKGFDPETTGPRDVIRVTNRRVHDSGLPAIFATAFFFLWIPETRVFGYARCGHNPARLYRAATGAVEHLDGAGALPLGVIEDIDLEPARGVLEPGDTIVLYTDGVTEAFGPDNELFGDKRLDDAIVNAPDRSPKGVIDSINTAVERFTRGAQPTDDRTMVVLRFNP